MDQHHDGSMHGMVVPPEIVVMMMPAHGSNDSKMVDIMDHVDVGNDSNDVGGANGGPKTWSQDDMDAALNALKTHNESDKCFGHLRYTVHIIVAIVTRRKRRASENVERGDYPDPWSFFL
jgi:hypothetical protein